jgi:hypothetical protein
MQFANHVIFYSPLLAASQQEYDAGMEQAIGRSLRYGQQRHVHIYHLLSLKTIDVNVFEQRRQKTLVRRNGEFRLIHDDKVLIDESQWRGRPLRSLGADQGDDYEDEED